MSLRLPLFGCLLTAALLFSTTAAAYTYIDSCGPTWADLPVPYRIHDAGTVHIPDQGDIDEVFHQAFEAWAHPCCSSFEGSFAGHTSTPPTETTDPVVLGFLDDHWPSAFGGSDVIGLTIIDLTGGCRIRRAPIVFNSFNHTFDLTGDQTDLLSIATHEVGHLLGLGHSLNAEATMFSHFVGGTSLRTLHDVDIDGVCSLYTAECGCTADDHCGPNEICDNGDCIVPPCTSDDDCDDDEICEEGRCLIPPCTSDSQCDHGQACVDGDCQLPPCASDDDCDEIFTCQSGRCLTTCPACRRCTHHDDCGADGYCHAFEHGGRCLISCGLDESCPGDSVCAVIEEGAAELPFCIAPTAQDHDHCPQNYDCIHFEGPDPCPGLGDNCSEVAFNCTVDNDICIDRADGSLICSCTCDDDLDCGPHRRCIDLPDGGRACIPGATDPCDDVECASDQQCFDGLCIDTPATHTDSGTSDSRCSHPPHAPPSSSLLLIAAFLILRRCRR